MSGPSIQPSNLPDGRSIKRDVSRRAASRATSSRPDDTRHVTGPATPSHNSPRPRAAEEERARAAARQAEKDMWEKTRGAGSSVFKLAEAGRIKRESKETDDTAEVWKAEDVLPSLEEVESKLYEVSFFFYL